MRDELVPSQPQLIRVDLPKRCYLLLTWEEYQRGIRRGKAQRRRQAYEKRQGVSPGEGASGTREN
jgi:hypothetical protein